ncbi:MAG TPA: hypothetical protein ENJ57_04830 [Rhizobiales bacterium]|nr:hypothetical protein [Hyphomicrobiales bacterium]
MDKTRKQTKGTKASSRKTGNTKRVQPGKTAKAAKGKTTKTTPSETNTAASEGNKDEKMTRSDLLSKDIENQSNIFTLPRNKGELPADDEENNSMADPIEEENLRALLLDLRKDITALKAEQEDAENEAAPDDEAHLYDLLASLKEDIKVLKVEQKETADTSDEAQMFAMLNELKQDIRELKAESEPVHAPEGEEYMFGLLAELKNDIKTLKDEHEAPAIPEGEEHMFALLADLKNDINTLKAEHASPAIPEGEEHLFGLLEDLKSDITVLKAEQNRHNIAEGEEHLYELLADLKGDIKVLKAETAATTHSEEDHLYGMLAELKQDINVLKHEHDVVPVPAVSPTVVAPPRTGGLGYMFAGALVVLLVLGAGAGGYYFSRLQQDTKMKTASSVVETQMAAPQPAPAPAASTAPVSTAPVTGVPVEKEVKTAAPARESAASQAGAAATPDMRVVSGKPGQDIDLKINLTGADIKPETAIVLVGIPENLTLSAGKRTEEGEWVMTVWDTLRLTLTAPADYAGDFEVTVSLMDAQGDLTQREKFKVVIAAPEAPARASEGAIAAAKSPAPVAPAAPVLTTPEQKELIERANRLMDQGDIVSARNVLDYAVSSGSAEAAFKLAQTYDPFYLGRIKSVLGVRPDLVKAKVLYYFAARKGHEEASKRLAVLRKEAGGSKP